MKNALRVVTAALLASTALGAGAMTASAEGMDPQVRANLDRAWADCEDACLYEHYDYVGKIDFVPKLGDLNYQDWDKTSSAINKTTKVMCLYSYDDKGYLRLQTWIPPKRAGGASADGTSPGNDTIDHVRLVPDLRGRGFKACRSVIPPITSR